MTTTFPPFIRLDLCRALLVLGVFVSLSCLLSGCDSADSSRAFNRADATNTTRTAASEASSRPSAAYRPGLGTEFGEERQSGSRRTVFVRANGNRPLATAAIYYDDREGARAQSGDPDEYRRYAEPPPQARGLIDLRLVGAGGFALRSFTAGGRRYVIGRPGDRYAIEVRNRTDSRLEIVLSVDGLDVLDGRAASYSKPGYVVAPRGSLRVDGFRTSSSTVAAFRFSSVQNSYANQRYGDTRNVGVIGAAVFAELGLGPLGDDEFDEETRRRRRADPFPGRGPFAEPPRRY